MKDAVEYLKTNLWTYITGPFSKEIVKSFKDEFDLAYIQLNEITDIGAILSKVQGRLPSLIDQSFKKFGDMIMENNSFLKDGSLGIISDHMYQLVYDWTNNNVLGVVQKKLEGEMNGVCDHVFERMTASLERDSIDVAFRNALMKMEGEVNTIFEKNWKLLTNQGAIRQDFADKSSVIYSSLQRDLYEYGGFEIPSELNTSTASSIRKSIPTNSSTMSILPSVPTTLHSPVSIQSPSSARSITPMLESA